MYLFSIFKKMYLFSTNSQKMQRNWLSLTLSLFLVLLPIARLRDAQIHTVVERVRLELLDVGGGAHPPLLVPAIAEPYGAAQAGSIEKQQEQRQRARHAAASEQERCME
jgi:hypothetical protein